MRQGENVTPPSYSEAPAAGAELNGGAVPASVPLAEAADPHLWLPEEAEACLLTKRVMIVSPFPNQVYGLVQSLSAACFDLFTLHEYDPAMVRSLQPELLIYDANPYAHTHATANESLREAIAQTAHAAGVPVLYLVNEQATLLPELPASAELLVWPASLQEAMFRINRLVMKHEAAGAAAHQDTMIFKDLKLDLKKMAVYRSGSRVDLTKTEYELLVLFLKSDGSVLSRESIFDGLWGSQFLGGSNVVDAHIKSLRKKLKDSAVAPQYIVTVRGAGYRLADERPE
ncbi:winged helix-turn-helix domain-containing protein [Paenibacillus protaetiae]|uniref:Response regulator transcription factor n=1 Tax=Paenibacillus protaetiae TaxID=2509456 RepID=A0A4P6EX80_9BACL|nr:response regulator transcription factor [Paenibacillus protaetiae]QAY67664.1 response regulator transcription factor [Paenibacillus protaetiae]